MLPVPLTGGEQDLDPGFFHPGHAGEENAMRCPFREGDAGDEELNALSGLEPSIAVMLLAKALVS